MNIPNVRKKIHQNSIDVDYKVRDISYKEIHNQIRGITFFPVITATPACNSVNVGIHRIMFNEGLL